MATLATQSVARPGVAPSYAAVSAGGDKFHPGDHVMLHVKNGGGASVDVTVTTPGSVDGLAIADSVTTIAAGAEAMIGPLPADLFRNSSDGLGSISYSASASVTAAVISVG